MKRDELLDTQLVEAKDRMDAYRRQQAENVTLTSLSIRRNRDGSVGWTGACEIVNDSGRPIRGVVCRMLINGNLIQPTEFRVREEFHRVMPILEQGEATIGYLPADEGTFNPDSGVYLHLLAHRVIRVGFPVEGNDHPGSPHFLIRFLDDAKFRWQLDDDMHLLPAPDGQW